MDDDGIPLIADTAKPTRQVRKGKKMPSKRLRGSWAKPLLCRKEKTEETEQVRYQPRNEESMWNMLREESGAERIDDRSESTEDQSETSESVEKDTSIPQWSPSEGVVFACDL